MTKFIENPNYFKQCVEQMFQRLRILKEFKELATCDSYSESTECLRDTAVEILHFRKHYIMHGLIVRDGVKLIALTVFSDEDGFKDVFDTWLDQVSNRDYDHILLDKLEELYHCYDGVNMISFDDWLTQFIVGQFDFGPLVMDQSIQL